MTAIVKVCGNRSGGELIAAARAGADLVGIIFANARRRVAVEDARRMVEELRAEVPNPPQVVGVFVDQPEEEVNRTADFVGLDFVQLHGKEGPDYWTRMERPLIIARRISTEIGLEAAEHELAPAEAYAEKMGYLCLVEPHVEGAPGGAGVQMKSDLAQGLAARFPFLLAGGLTPETVADVIRTVRPWGVDVSSGVETNGVKDLAKVGRFVHEARRAGQTVNQVRFKMS